MNQSKINRAASQARRFLQAAHALHKLSRSDWEITGNKFSGAVRRASMDLTRARKAG